MNNLINVIALCFIDIFLFGFSQRSLFATVILIGTFKQELNDCFVS